MKESFRYHMPTRILFRPGGIDFLDASLDGRKTLILTTAGGLQRGVGQHLNRLHAPVVATVTEVASHPQFCQLEPLHRQLAELDVEVILAVGGGSVLDAAKFLSVRSRMAGVDSAALARALTRGERERSGYCTIPIVAVPTTAGTGSELTPWATIWEMEEKKKYSLHLPELFCETAVYDPQLTLTLPRELTIHAALDTLSHALESIWNRNASPITRTYAIKAARLIMANLAALSRELHSPLLRSCIMEACMYAAMAFSNTQTALAHAMSYYITAHKGVPHGLACSFSLPMLIDTVAGHCADVDAALREIFGECTSQPLRRLYSELEVATEFADYGLDEEEVEVLRKSLGSVQRAGNSLVEFPV